MSKEMNLSSPWVTFFNELKELFSFDNEVKVELNDKNDKKEISIYVDNEFKADALSKLLKSYKEFGNVVVNINVYPANTGEKSQLELFQTVFSGNKSIARVESRKDVFGNEINYLVFKPDIAQFFNDNIGDINGNKTMLYSDIAEDIFNEHDGIFFCTDKKRVYF